MHLLIVQSVCMFGLSFNLGIYVCSSEILISIDHLRYGKIAPSKSIDSNINLH